MNTNQLTLNNYYGELNKHKKCARNICITKYSNYSACYTMGNDDANASTSAFKSTILFCKPSSSFTTESLPLKNPSTTPSPPHHHHHLSPHPAHPSPTDTPDPKTPLLYETLRRPNLSSSTPLFPPSHHRNLMVVRPILQRWKDRVIDPFHEFPPGKDHTGPWTTECFCV